MKRYKQTIIVILIILFLGTVFHKNYINEFPSYIHAWAQSDRYALSLGFINNGLNFFKPETFVLNHQFPDEWNVPSKESITAVDFPIHDYIPAIVMKIMGNTSPWIFRIYILLYSFIGLFFLFQLSKLLTGNFYKSVFVTVFAATSPVFVYYQSGFLPTIPSLANVILGIFFYTKYLFAKKDKDFNLCIVFISLAALSRTTFAIPLIAILGLEIFLAIQGKTKIKPKLLPILFSLSAILFFFIYNGILRAKYGSIFLNHFMPAKSIQQIIEILKIVKENWATQYFSNIHYFVLTLLVLRSIILLITKKVRINKETQTILFLIILIFIGYFVFALLMIRQFANHDYYFLDTFFLPVILLLIFAISAIPSNKTKSINYIFIISIVAISILMIFNASDSQKSRRVTGYWDRTSATINNFKGADKFLNSQNIPENAKILVLDACAPNIPFILMHRKGFAIMSTSKENIQNALTWDFDYLVLQDEFFISDIYSSYPKILSKISKIADNNRISICKLNHNETDQTITEFIGLDGKTPVFKAIMTYDTTAEESWQNTNQTSGVYFSGISSGVLTKDMTYGLTYKTKKLPIIRDKSRLLLFNSYFFCDTISDCEIVVTINENGQKSYYKNYNLRDLLRSKNKWEKVILLFQLPQVKSKDYEFGIFIWNTGKNNLFIDDFEFLIY